MKYSICLAPIVANLMTGDITGLDAGYPHGQMLLSEEFRGQILNEDEREQED